MKSRPFLLLTKRPVLAGVVAFLLLLGPGLYISYLRYTLHQSPATVFVIFACLLSLAGGLFAWYVASRYESLKKQMDEKDHLLRKVEASIPSFFSQEVNAALTRDRPNTISSDLAIEMKALDQQFKTMIEKSPVGAFILSRERLIYVNQRFSEIFGYSEDEVLALGTLESLFYKDDIAQVKKYTQLRLGSKNNTDHYEVRGIRKDGNIVWLELYAQVTTEGGDAVIGTLQHITESKGTTMGILQERNLLNMLIKALPGIFYVVDTDGRFLQWNENLEKLTGCDHDELRTKYTTDFVDQSWTSFIQHKRAEAFSTGKATGEVEIVTKDNQRLCYYITIMPVLYDNRECILGVGLDFTQKKEAELSLMQRSTELKERVKELHCLYTVSDLANNAKYSVKDMLSMCVGVIPSAYQYPPITRARIVIGEQRSESDGFMETSWKQEADIKVKGHAIGKITIVYTEEKEASAEGPFLKEERLLLDSLADIIGNACERRFAETEVSRLGRLYQFTSAINESILRAENREIVFLSACQVAIEHGKFSMAWIGIYNKESQTVIPFTWAGHNDGYLDRLTVPVDTNLFGQGPIGNVIRSRSYYYCNDIANDPVMSPWRDEALKRGFRSSITLPIITNSKLEAVFTLYMFEAFFFNEEEIKLLTDVTNNIAYALEKLDLKLQQEKAEVELRESEEKFRSLVEGTLVSIFIMQNGQFIYVNPQFERTFGYTEHALLYEMSFEQLIHPDDLSMIRKKQQAIAANEKAYDHFTFKAIRSDQAVLHMEIIVSPITYQSKRATIGTIIDITEEVEKEKRLSKAVTDAQESERRQIGMELHDNVKQILTATALNVDFIDTALNDKETLDRVIGNAKSYLREAIEELRKLSHRLSPSIDSTLSLEEKFKALVRSMIVSDATRVIYHFDEFERPIEDDIQLMLYRILQEQLTNIIKHANASLVEIALRDDNGDIELMVKDNGNGFDTTSVKSGIGLENIKRRLTALDGKMEVVSSPGNGYSLVARIPKESRQ